MQLVEVDGHRLSHENALLGEAGETYRALGFDECLVRGGWVREFVGWMGREVQDGVLSGSSEGEGSEACLRLSCCWWWWWCHGVLRVLGSPIRRLWLFSVPSWTSVLETRTSFGFC